MNINKLENKTGQMQIGLATLGVPYKQPKEKQIFKNDESPFKFMTMPTVA